MLCNIYSHTHAHKAARIHRWCLTSSVVLTTHTCGYVLVRVDGLLSVLNSSYVIHHTYISMLCNIYSHTHAPKAARIHRCVLITPVRNMLCYNMTFF